MSDDRSRLERAPSILPRHAAALVDRALHVFPVVVVMGARQTGKSTLVRTHPRTAGRRYLTLDDLDTRLSAAEAPDDLVRCADELVIDEVQREPALLLAIKRVVDEEHPRRPGRFVLTGSANLLLMQRVSETLAGRATYVNLWPLTRSELAGAGGSGAWSMLFDGEWDTACERLEHAAAEPADWRAVARTGGYPTPAHELTDAADRGLWFRAYVQTYLERDLQALSSIDRLADFRRLMEATCLRLGNLLNQTELGRDAGLPRPTVHRYLNLLETSCQLVRLPPYSVNRTKRLIKAPKAFWSDTGLALHLGGGEPSGAHLENLILQHLLAWRDAEADPPRVLYWRTASGQEVDLVIERRGRLLAIEVKATMRPSLRDAARLKVFRDEYADLFHGGLLLHCGEDCFRAGRGIHVLPWWRVI